jgi:hypothetical protein
MARGWEKGERTNRGGKHSVREERIVDLNEKDKDNS